MTLLLRPFDLDLGNLHARLQRSLHAMGVDFPRDGRFRLVAPTPTYVVGGEALAAEGVVTVREAGWRGIIASGDDYIALVEISQIEGRLEYAIRDRDAATAFAGALVVAQNYVAMPEKLEVRFLSAPDIYLSVVWLQGAGSIFIPTRLVSRPAKDLALVLDEGLLREVAARLASRAPPGDGQDRREALAPAASPISGLRSLPNE